MPKVSVCIPTYNSARYLAEAIDSVLRQKFGDFELVVCDNASTDETAQICSRYKDARFRYVRFEELTNQAGSWNRCLSEARGEYLTFLHADDLLLPGFLADRVDSLEDDPALGFVFGVVLIIDADGVVVRINGYWHDDRIFKAGELVDAILVGCFVAFASLMVRKSAADKVGPFRTDFSWGHDWEWFIRFAERFGSLYASKPLGAYRVHAESGTAEQFNGAKIGHQEERILKETLARLEVADSRFRRLRRPALRALSRRNMYYAANSLLDGRKQAARNNLWYAAKADINAVTSPTFWAILAASGGSPNWYLRYRRFRESIERLGKEPWDADQLQAVLEHPHSLGRFVSGESSR
jgi:glycosyltransferase involved in cell wall biosynthesis